MRSTRRSGQDTSTMATAATTEYTTPARTADDAPENTSQVADTKNEPHHVTPPDNAKEETSTTEETLQAVESTGGKQVRFGADEKEETDSPQSNSRGLVSKRGRFVSPGRRQGSTNSPPENQKETTVLEYKTYRSPPRKREESEVPSLCSTNSGTLLEEKKKAAAIAPASSISCDPSAIQNTSPLASHEAEEKKDRNMSPPPPSKEDQKQAPVKSPKSGNFQTLPSLNDSKAASPGGIFLSPNPPTPSHRNIQDASSFEEKKRDSTEEEDAKPSPRRDREHYVATPTDFALDYGKGNQVSGSFDTSNVLAWLQSPTANGLFSPGGYGSMLNTPHAGGAPRTPRTPTVSTSFFFSDVASLPRGDSTPTKGGQEGNKRSQKGISNIICISPLASTKTRTGSTTTTPVNLKDVFGSPDEKTNVRGLPLLNDSPNKAARPRVPQRSGSKDPSLDAVHLAERDLMEDEDLSVLLQLASNTPRSAERGAAVRDSSGAGPVFRSPSGGRKEEQSGRSDGNDGENLPALQLPMIGDGRDGEASATRLTQKSRSRDHADANDFAPPQLGMRSGSSSGGSKEIYVGGKAKTETKSAKESSGDKIDSDKNVPKKTTKKGPSSNPYPLHQSYPPHPGQDHPYYSMSGALPGMPPGGSMRVVVGGPPPPRPGSKGGSPSRPGLGGSPHAPPGLYHDFPPGGMPYAPPHGMYSQYPGPYPGMGGYPYQSHYPPPPPRHMPMYGAQHPPGGPNNVKKLKSANKSVKSGGKRNSPLLDPKTAGGAVKKRKTPSSHQKKKKKTTPEISNAERQKAAAAIQSVNAASGGKNDKAAALAAAILRGVTMRPSGKWQAQLYFAGKSRYIGVFDTREKAALAYEIAREKLKSGSQETGGSNPKTTENLVNAARKAAFEGVNERSKA